MVHTQVSLKFEDWPEVDRILVTAQFRGDSIFDCGTLAKLGKRSRDSIVWVYGAYLLFNIKIDAAFPTLPIPERIDDQRIITYLQSLKARGLSPASLSRHASALTTLFSALEPKRGFARLRWLAMSLRRDGRQRNVRAPLGSEVLLSFGEELCRDAEARLQVGSGRERTKALIDYRDGLIIAFLARIPLRRSNLIDLQLGTTLQQVGTSFVITFPGNSMKGGRSYEATVPDQLAPTLRFYLDNVRPLFRDLDKDAYLWRSPKGRLTGDGIYKMCVQRTRKRFGVAVTLHQFRSEAATTLARAAPLKINIARDLLHHADLKTTEQHYIRARGISSSRAINAVLQNRTHPERG